ncbi:sigma factor regulator N-terminal domain-containing protein [Clostridium sp. Marseille-Q7071]
MEKDNKNINEELASNIEKENIEDIFSDKKIKRSIRITKIKSLFKIVFVFFVCLVITRFCNYYYLEYLDDKMVRQNTYYLNISSPNIEFSGTGSQIGFFSGQSITGYNKYVNGVRVSLGGIKYNYGFLNKNNGKFEYTVDILPRLSENPKDIEEKTVYNGLGHRLMKFYHPKVSF